MQVLFALVSIAGAALTSGEAIRVGAGDGTGPFAADKLFNHPVGAAHALGNELPDLFVIAGSRFYPELVVYPSLGRSDAGVPIFGEAHVVAAPEVVTYASPGTIFEHNGAVHALWLDKAELVHLIFNSVACAFMETERVAMPTLPRGASCIGWLPDAEGAGFTLLMSISDGVRGGPGDGIDSRDAFYMPYDGAGVWRGGFPYAALYEAHFPSLLAGPAGAAVQATPSAREVRDSHKRLTRVDLGPGHEHDAIGGSIYGPLLHYTATADGAFEAGRMLADANGIALRHPTIGPAPAVYPNPEGRWCDLIAGGEGALYYYRFSGSFTESGQPIYHEPVYSLQRDAALYAGSLPVLTVVDWDGDDILDIVAGNSEGEILFFDNAGTNEVPAFASGVALEAGGERIHLQAGYSGSIQGPSEARWGYVCPTVTDWSGDGLVDIVLSSASGNHVVYVNAGSRTDPRLASAEPLYLDGLDLHGTWRVQPGVAPLDGRMAYVALDDQDEFHLYWLADVYNVTDGGKLRLDTGGVIGANFLRAGGTGRIKIVLTDWDEDGATDMIVGTPRHASIPEPKLGLPQALGLPGSSVMWLKNTGSDAAPAFAHPKVLHFRGEPIFFGQHACSPAVARLGGGEKPGLIVGVETGRLRFFAREDITFETMTPVPKP